MTSKPLIFFILILLTHHSYAQTIDKPINFNSNWEFVKDIDTSATQTLLLKNAGSITWQKVSLPHTPRLEPVVKTTFEQWQGTCYYRKYFTLPVADRQKRVAIKFDAAMHEADVYLNGKHLFKHIGGYLPFEIDLSNRLNYGKENCILVKLNNQDNPHIPPGKNIKDLDFNYYGGIYRNTWLIVEDKVHITDAVSANREAGGGILIHYEKVSKATAKLLVKTEVQNDSADPSSIQIKTILADAKGKLVVSFLSAPQNLKTNSHQSFEQSLLVKAPQLWSPLQPYLYTLHVQVIKNGKVISQQTLKTGVKTFRFGADGFYLNGDKLSISGTNRHQEYPYVGYALSDNAQYRDAWKIKQAGFNFVRCSHYPPSTVFLDACDELGIMVMDAIPGWQFFGDEIFQQNSFQDIRDMLHRDRNHASIILWEASLNESDMSKPYMDRANQIVHQELPFTDVFSTGWKDYGYDVSNPARQHAKAPDYWKNYSKKKPLLIAEYGDWEYYAQNAGFNQKEYAGLKSEARNSRQLRTDGQDRMLQQALNFQEAHNDNLYGPAVGDVNWLMFDYKRGYAADIESSGIMDIYRIPKYAFYFYQSQAGPVTDGRTFGKPMIYIANYWNSPADKTVKVYSNCDEVELLINGKSIARQHPDHDQYSANLTHAPFTFDLAKFEPGKIQAIGYINGKKTIESTRETAGKPAAIKLTFDYSGKGASDNDVIFVYASVVDDKGTVVPDANPQVDFSVDGDAQIIGQPSVKAEAGIATALLKIKKLGKVLTIKAEAKGLDGSVVSLVQ
ncbi:glycoside hydrolase family 2 protein [Mucilaginibacter paludis]|uniref:Glycoside hydrolase family 2 sugar binding n=1 Tax=Mucilaginibacter paludis DSM 18603 TaxID=714943 RepID=H1YBD2_9SPHI|nr:glycoside hydrolase family 2 TIM barrel-domain containing protein [Mucilaginibacter paludis]EHQ31186.1 glycoside hydrolase family 2 sugar binding [Mucilaginibacter paludis DSM 18603]